MKSVIVYGQRRSGTSLFAGVLYYLGIPMGKEALPTQVSDRNPKGFFEDRSIIKISEVMIQYIMRYESIDASIEKLKQLFGVQIEKAINKRKSNCNGIWGVKDVNMIDLLDVYRSYLTQAHFIVVHRNPLDVAKSYSDWHKTEVENSLAMVMKNYEKINESMAFENNKLLVSYDEAIQSPEKVVNEIIEFLRIQVTQEQLNNAIKHIGK